MLGHNLDAAFWRCYLAKAMRFADVLVIATEGSTYRKAGARMIVGADGAQWGMVAGGCFDALIRDEADAVMTAQTPRTFAVDTRAEDDALFGSGLGCQGRVVMWITPLPEHLSQADLEQYLGIGFQHRDDAVIYALTSGRLFSEGERRCVRAEAAKEFLPPSSENLMSVLAPASDLSGGSELFVEYRLATPRALIFGGGDDVIPLVSLLHTMGWVSWVIDSKDLNPKLSPLRAHFRFIQAHPDSFFADFQPRPHDFLVAMSHRYETDLTVMCHVVSKDFGYIGFLGPKLRGERLLSDVRQLGITIPNSFYTRFYNPCGIDLQGRGPEAIALSIVAEMHALLCNGTLKHLSDWQHERST